MIKIYQIVIAILLTLSSPTKPKGPPDSFQIQRAYITTYNWGLGGHNTDGHPGVSSGLPTEDWLFDVGVACPFDWVGNVNLKDAGTIVVTFPEWSGLGERWCVDTFGSPENRKPVYLDGQWKIRFDIPARDPFSHPLNNETITGFTTEWRPYSELLAEHPLN